MPSSMRRVLDAAGDVASQLDSSKRRVYEVAVQLVQRNLADIGQQHEVAQGVLDSLYAEVRLKGGQRPLLLKSCAVRALQVHGRGQPCAAMFWACPLVAPMALQLPGRE